MSASSAQKDQTADHVIEFRHTEHCFSVLSEDVNLNRTSGRLMLTYICQEVESLKLKTANFGGFFLYQVCVFYFFISINCKPFFKQGIHGPYPFGQS